MTLHRYFATAQRNVEDLLAIELAALGATEVSQGRGGVQFAGSLTVGYQACLWSRTANRILLHLVTFDAGDADALYAGIRRIDWSSHVAADGSIAVTFSAGSSTITHSHYGALKVKDAIVDQMREACGSRPSVDTAKPDLRINVYLFRNVATVAIDLSGDGMHRRGYRARGVAAPLKENLAAAILLRAGWPAMAANGAAFVDPMCGSGTLPIEAAMMAGDIAPGIGRDYWGFSGWRGHDADIWQSLLDDAKRRQSAGLQQLTSVRGYEADASAVRAALANIEAAGLTGSVHIEKRDLADCEPGKPDDRGLIAANPPYGERLGSGPELKALYGRLGTLFTERFAGWRAAVITGDVELGHALNLRAERMHTLFNGAIECRLLHFDLAPDRIRVRQQGPRALDADRRSEQAAMFQNRLTRNVRHLRKWARRAGISCYRIYDRDLPDFAVAIDLYTSVDDEVYAHVQEYEAPATIDARQAARRLREALGVVADVLEIGHDAVIVKTRRKQKGSAQYERLETTGAFIEVEENGCRFLVNLRDYLDTGLFLDHRETRALLGELAAGRHFLNLFGYTGTASVYAARGGATGTTTVDLSNTYLEWARRNYVLNGMPQREHVLLREDCLAWLDANHGARRYGLIFVDPPTFSTSKRMQGTLDVQRDHVAMIEKSGALLEPDGVMIFSCNLRSFRMDTEALSTYRITDLSRASLPKDFERNPHIHSTFRLERH